MLACCARSASRSYTSALSVLYGGLRVPVPDKSRELSTNGHLRKIQGSASSPHYLCRRAQNARLSACALAMEEAPWTSLRASHDELRLDVTLVTGQSFRFDGANDVTRHANWEDLNLLADVHSRFPSRPRPPLHPSHHCCVSLYARGP